MLAITDLFDLSHTRAAEYLSRFTYPWEALEGLSDFIVRLGASLPAEEFDEISEGVWVHKTAAVAPTAFLGAPCVIDADTEVRHCAFVRGSALIGKNCVVGNSVEVKNAILFDSVQTPHYNYVGDSILGFRAHMGAGSITSNVRADKKNVRVHAPEGDIDTGLFKFGAMLGDDVEIGCNAVLNPGTVVGRRTNIYPLSCVRGVIPADSVFKTGAVIVPKE